MWKCWICGAVVVVVSGRRLSPGICRGVERREKGCDNSANGFFVCIIMVYGSALSRYGA